MRLIGNILWIVLIGFWTALVYWIVGFLLTLLVITAPLGKALIKIGTAYFTPFGRKVRISFMRHPIANIIWTFLLGWELCILHILMGIGLCVTIIGIPFGIQSFKMAKLQFAPFGSKI